MRVARIGNKSRNAPPFKIGTNAIFACTMCLLSATFITVRMLGFQSELGVAGSIAELGDKPQRGLESVASPDENNDGGEGANRRIPPPDFTRLDTNFSLVSERAPRCAKLAPDDVEFTIITQTSENRLWIMEEQCKRWKGPISIAVATSRSHSTIYKELTKKYGCSPKQISLVVREVDMDNYPINVLRNLALRNVHTTHFVNVDIDFMISDSVESTLMRQDVRQAFADDAKLAAVLPAFQIEVRGCRRFKKGCEEKSRDMMPFDFQTLERLRHTPVLGGDMIQVLDKDNRDTIASPFLERKFIHAHNSTDYVDWFEQSRALRDGRSDVKMLRPIPCVDAGMYEPYLTLRYCRDTPPFQYQFTGYGQNKVSWLYHVRRSGFQFKQLAGAFVTHFPHRASTAREAWQKGPKEQKNWRRRPVNKGYKVENLMEFKRGRSDRLFVEFLKWVNANVPSRMRTPNCPYFVDARSRLWVEDEDQSGAFER